MASKKRIRAIPKTQPKPVVKESISLIPLALVLIVAAGSLAYANTFRVPFLFSDVTNIVENETIRNLANIKSIFQSSAGSGVANRPMVNFTLALNYAISGNDVWSYHAFNILIHLLSALTLFGIFRRVFLSERLSDRYGHIAMPLAFGCALIWVLHPIQSQAVTYIIQRCESMMGLFFLLVFYCSIRGWSSSSPKIWHAAAILSFLLGAGSKEVIAVAPFLLFLFDTVFFHQRAKDALRCSPLLYGGLFAGELLVVWLAFRGLPMQTIPAVPFTLLQYWQTQPGIILHYLNLVIWPNALSFDYAWQAASPVEALPSIIVLAVMLAGAVWLLFKRQPAGFLIVWIFIILAPTSLVPLLDQAFEYRMYLPSIAVIVLIVTGFYEAGNRLSSHFHLKEQNLRMILVLLLIGTALVLGSVTYARNQTYRSNLLLWEDTVRKRPSNAKAHLNLGMANFNMGRADAAIRHFQEALNLKQNYTEAYTNMGGALLSIQKREEALFYFRKGLTMNPDARMAAWIHSNMGVALFESGRQREAVENFRQAIRLQPDQAEYYANLGTALERMNQLPEAVAAWEQALRVRPDFKIVQERLIAVRQKQRAGQR